MTVTVDDTTTWRSRRGIARRSRATLLTTTKTAVGITAYIGVWEIAGRREWFGRTFPPVSDVIVKITDDAQRPVLQRALSATARAALGGFAIGITAAFAGAVMALLVPMLRPGINQLATIVHAVPIIALAPLFIVTLGREHTPTAIAAIAAGFAMFVAATAAVEAATAQQHDLFTALGASTRQRFRMLELPAATPGLVDGLRLAAPASVLGAVIGEWFGAPRGLGLLIVSAMQNFQIELLWAAALLAALMSMVSFGLFTLLSTWASRRWSVTL